METLHLIEDPPKKRGRGRPAGSKNKPKPQPEEAQPVAMAAPEPPPQIDAITAPAVELGAIEQARKTFQAGNRLAALVGFALGGFVPLASFTLIHFEAQRQPLLWILVIGGLAYSALSVYRWAQEAFRYRIKAAGFVILLEGAMSFSSVHWLSLAGLAILIGINGVSAAVSLQQGRD
jgi:hypothetical protein